MTKWLITTLLLFLAGCDRSGQQPNTPPRSQPQETTPQPAYTEPTEAERRLGYYEYCRGVAYPEYWQNPPSPGPYRGEYGGVMDTSLNGWHFHTEMTRPDTVLLRYLFLNETLLIITTARGQPLRVGRVE